MGMTLAEASRPTWPSHSMDLGRDMERMTFVDQKAAQDSLYEYCKPVELYNIIQRRSLQQPVFLQRCLSYKIRAAREKRTKMTVATIDSTNTPRAFETFSVFVQVSSSLPDFEKDGFLLSDTTRMIACNEELSFLLPELRKLTLHAHRENSFILFIITADYSKICPSSLDKYNGNVFWGKLSLSTVCEGWMDHLRNANESARFSDTRVALLYEVNMDHGTIQHEEYSGGRRIKLRRLINQANLLPPLRVRIAGEELGRNAYRIPELPNGIKRKTGRVVFHYLYHYNRFRKLEATENFSCPFCLALCSSFKGLRCHLDASHDRFIFEFLATEDVQAVFVTCKSAVLGLEGVDREVEHDPRLKSFTYCSRKRKLKCPENGKPQPRTARAPLANGHLNGVNGSAALLRKGYEHSSGSYKDSTCTFGAANGQFLRQEVFLDGSSQKPEAQLKRKADDLGKQPEEARSVASTSVQDFTDRREPPGSFPQRRHSLPASKKQRVESNMWGIVQRHQSFPAENQLKVTGSVIRAGGRDGSALLPPKMNVKSAQRVERSRKVPSERAEARNRALLQKRQFFHAHTGQPMTTEQLLLEEDSEEELDDAIASWEDRRMLDDFVDVTKDEKDVMHLWNDFVRRQRVIADGHCPWACEAFAKLHAEKFSKSASLRRCFMLMLVKLWNNQLIDGRVLNQCLSVVDSWTVPPS